MSLELTVFPSSSSGSGYTTSTGVPWGRGLPLLELYIIIWGSVDVNVLHGLKQTVRGRLPRYVRAPCKLTLDLLILKVVSESRVTWPTSVPILIFLGLSVLDLGPMIATDRSTDVRRASSLKVSALWGHNNLTYRA